MKKKMILLTTVLVLALGSLGVAYAAWTDEITISGSVDTGSLCWEFADCRVLDKYPPANPGGDYPTAIPDWGCNPGFVRDPVEGYFWEYNKNVAWGECEISADGKTLTNTIHNAYPCYFNEIGWYVHNCGTLPLIIDHVVVTVGGVDYVLTKTGYLAFDADGDGENDWEMTYGDNFGVQLEPDEFTPDEFSMWLHVLQPAPQGTTVEGGDALTFTIKLVAVQWDKYPLSLTEPGLVA